MSDLIRYSKIRKKRNMRFLKRKFKNTNNSILYDVGASDNLTNAVLNLNNIKNIVLDNNCQYKIQIINNKAHNIYFHNSINLGGITLPISNILESKHGFYFEWTDFKPEIDKINIVGKEIKTIKVENLEKVKINRGGEKVHIIIEEESMDNEYIIDNLGNIKILKKVYYITNKDIVNNEINLSDIIDFKEIFIYEGEDIKIDHLILNIKCINNLDKIHNILKQIEYKKIIIQDENKMRLNPTIKELNNSESGAIKTFNKNKNYILYNNKELNNCESGAIKTFNKNKNYILYNNKELIYYENDEIKTITKKNLLENPLIESIYVHNEDNIEEIPVLIINYKNNITKIFYLDIEIEIDKTFMWFITHHPLYEYFSYDDSKTAFNISKLLETNSWGILFLENYVDFNKLEIMYKDYLSFIKKIKILKEMGYTSKTIKTHYLHLKDYIDLEKNIIEKISDEWIDRDNEFAEFIINNRLNIGTFFGLEIEDIDSMIHKDIKGFNESEYIKKYTLKNKKAGMNIEKKPLKK